MEPDFYLDFENNFRGSTDQIKDILSNYDGLIKYIINIDDQPTLLDIGCGRGEWLKKCTDDGIKSCGIELNHEMAESCKQLGLDILEGDAMTILGDFSDNSFSLITIFHMIEHITFEDINSLLIECKRLLKSNGLLIIETPSIDNLSISSRLFYIDPTHINPINPDLIAFTMGRNGFDMVQTFYINGGPLQYEDKYSLTRIFNGVAQDLLFVATKSKSSTLQLTNDNSWKKSLNIALTTIDTAVEFDHELRRQIIKNEESMCNMRARIYSLEKQLDSVLKSKFYKKITSLSFNENKFRQLINIKNRISHFIFRIMRFFINKSYKIINKYLFKDNEIAFIFNLVLDKILRNFRYRMKYGKLLKISPRSKEEKELIDLNVKRLDLHYLSSSKPSDIYKELK